MMLYERRAKQLGAKDVKREGAAAAEQQIDRYKPQKEKDDPGAYG